MAVGRGRLWHDRPQSLRHEGVLPRWQTILELDFQVRKRACHLSNTTGVSLATTLVTAREDVNLYQRYFTTPTALTAGLEAAHSASSASSTTQPGTIRDLLPQLSSQVTKLVKDAMGSRSDSGGGGGGGGRRRGRTAPKKAAASKTTTCKQTGSDSNARRTVLSKIHSLAMKQKKCIRHNKFTCKVLNCKWAHDCAVCGKKGCAADKHKEYAIPDE